jgi:phage baseplate assembly protein W
MTGNAGDFVGTGWCFPPDVDAGGGIAMVSGDTELVQAMQLILLTYPGERPMRPEFGSRLRDYVFADATGMNAALLAREVRMSLAMWEPRVDIEAVDVVPDVQDVGMFHIDIAYTVKGTNDRRNLVFPFYTIPGEESEY